MDKIKSYSVDTAWEPVRSTLSGNAQNCCVRPCILTSSPGGFYAQSISRSTGLENAWLETGEIITQLSQIEEQVDLNCLVPCLQMEKVRSPLRPLFFPLCTHWHPSLSFLTACSHVVYMMVTWLCLNFTSAITFQIFSNMISPLALQMSYLHGPYLFPFLGDSFLHQSRHNMKEKNGLAWECTDSGSAARIGWVILGVKWDPRSSLTKAGA